MWKPSPCNPAASRHGGQQDLRNLMALAQLCFVLCVCGLVGVVLLVERSVSKLVSSRSSTRRHIPSLLSGSFQPPHLGFAPATDTNNEHQTQDTKLLLALSHIARINKLIVLVHPCLHVSIDCLRPLPPRLKHLLRPMILSRLTKEAVWGWPSHLALGVSCSSLPPRRRL